MEEADDELRGLMAPHRAFASLTRSRVGRGKKEDWHPHD
jgi:hypothetical protein